MLEGFERVNLGPESPAILISKSGITFNKSAILALDKSPWVNVLEKFHESKLAVVKCESPDSSSMPFFNAAKKNTLVVRWTNRTLLRLLDAQMGWNHNEYAYKVYGYYSAEDKAIIFNLKEAITVI